MKKKNGIVELKAARLTASAAKKHAEADLQAIDAQLLLLVPPGTEQEGVVHVSGEASSPAWKQIYEQVVKELVPRARQGVLPEMILAHTGKKKDFIRVRGGEQDA